ncbi:MAG: hypothetical protein FJW35_09890 [Acidobacteria bacterium]|nr:hypothetical protein [Acidobacteriota bacterium]
MPLICAWIIALLLALPALQERSYFMPTSTVVRIASMAARYEGYDSEARGTYLDELRARDGKEPLPGYSSIGLYKDGHLIRSYSIRIATGDVIDANECKIFRYPGLERFRKETMKRFGTRELTLGELASEVGCDKLEVVADPIRGQNWK